MADLEILPTWAVNYVNENLSDHVHVINALPVDGGRHKGAFLVNTSQGAVLLTRRRGGEPKHWFLPLPASHFSFICQVCMERIEFVDPDVPRTVYCTHCGTRYRLALEHGAMVLRRDEATPAKPTPAVTPTPTPVAKPTPKPAPTPKTVAKSGPFTHNGFTLYQRETPTKGGGATTFYFFAKKTPKSGSPTTKPDGYSVEVNERTKLPYLRRDDKVIATPKSQCGAVTDDGRQCRLTAGEGRSYCHLHKGFKPMRRDEIVVRMDSKPRAVGAVDTLPGEGDRGKRTNQCAAVTAAGSQCSNRSRDGSKYCGGHKGYRPSKALKISDTKPVGRRVKDTAPTVKRG